MATNVSVLDAVISGTPEATLLQAVLGLSLYTITLIVRDIIASQAKKTRTQAEALILEKEGQLRVRYLRRQDGRIITQDCTAQSKFRKPAVHFAVLAFLFMVVLVIAGMFTGDHEDNFLRRVEPFRTVMEWIAPEPAVTGKIRLCAPTNPAPQKPSVF